MEPVARRPASRRMDSHPVTASSVVFSTAGNNHERLAGTIPSLNALMVPP
jgi:hypothetical protein